MASGATNPTLAPASIAILQIVILLSTEIESIYEPENSIAYPVPPAVPIRPIKYKTISLDVTFSEGLPSNLTRIFFNFETFRH